MAEDTGFHSNIQEFKALMQKTPAAASKGAARGIRVAGDEWRKAAQKIALKKTGNLRKNIKRLPVKTVSGDGWFATISANAYAKKPWNGQPFNYAYYWHEVKKTVKHPTTPGTTATFLDDSGKELQQELLDMIEKEIMAELFGKGW